jgi:hypothetical protein
MPLHCTMVNAGRQIGGYPIRQYKLTGWVGISNVNGRGQRRLLATSACRSRAMRYSHLS